MRELPINLNSRIRIITNQMSKQEAYGLHNISSESEEMIYQFVSNMLLNNKVIFISEISTFFYNGKIYECSTFKIDNIQVFNSMIQKKFDESRLVFCYYGLSLLPTIYNPNNHNRSQAIMLIGAFVPVSEEFELRDIINRDEQIEKILND
jgi:hypothetical protein